MQSISLTKIRCPWVKLDDPLYVKYHDSEWGTPVWNDRTLFEFLVLEIFQAGLSWRTVLHKRQNFKKAFANFDPVKVAKFGAKEINRLIKDAGIIRNAAKIKATINNARKFLEIQKEFGSFAKYQWSFVKNKPIQHKLKKLSDYPTTIPEAVAFSQDLKKRCFQFLGPIVVYAHMQAVGMVNDHTVDCWRRIAQP